MTDSLWRSLRFHQPRLIALHLKDEEEDGIPSCTTFLFYAGASANPRRKMAAEELKGRLIGNFSGDRGTPTTVHLEQEQRYDQLWQRISFLT